MKKNYAISLILFMFTSPVFAEISQTEIDNLKKQISELKKIVDSQKTEISRLKKLCLQAGININPKEKKTSIPAKSGISKPMFGVHLGETLNSLNQRFRVSRSSYSFEDKDHPGEIWTVQNDNSNVKHILVYTINEKVYEIDIQFADGSRTNYDTINSQLEKKYKSKDEGGLTGAMFGEGSFKTMIDGTEIKIKLNHDIGFMEDDKLELQYIHVPLRDKVYEEIKRRKANKISGDL